LVRRSWVWTSDDARMLFKTNCTGAQLAAMLRVLGHSGATRRGSEQQTLESCTYVCHTARSCRRVGFAAQEHRPRARVLSLSPPAFPRHALTALCSCR
jgi:hypothetical protein